MKDLWTYRWRAFGLFWVFYSWLYLEPVWYVGLFGLTSMMVVFLIISSSHDGWIAKRRAERQK